MVFHVSRGGHGCREIVDIHLSPHVLEISVPLELFRDGYNVHWVLVDTERLNGRKHFLVAWFIEGFRSQDFAYHGECILVDH